MTREERVAAYVDGELDESARQAFEFDMAADTELAQAVSAQRDLRERLAAAYAPALEETVPLRLTLAAQAANESGRRRVALPAWAAMAACLVAGVILGRGLAPPSGPVAVRGGDLVLGGGLGRALSGQLAGDEGAVRIGVSFRAADGRYCRTFTSAHDKLAGLACREADGWRARALSAWSPPPQSGYRTAASETPPAILAAMDERISGQPLDAAGEKAARAKGWTP